MSGKAVPLSAEAKAAWHRRAREARRLSVTQDYVRSIAELIAERGEARVTDLSDQLGLASATVSFQIRCLVKDGLVRARRYRSIHLTPAGQHLAATLVERRAIVRNLLVALGADRETAETDAEGMEHHASESTLAAIRNALTEHDGWLRAGGGSSRCGVTDSTHLDESTVG